MKRTAYCLTAILSLVTLLPTAHAQLLGTAQSFAVIGSSTVTNTGPSVLTGDVGLWSGTSITGFPPGTVVDGTMHITDAVAQQAHNDAFTAYTALAGMASTAILTGSDLGGMTLTPGTYFFATSAFLTGTLTLDAQGDPDALFVFQIGSTLISASDSSVVLINSADGCNVYWQVGSSATLGTETTFNGNILALASITLNTGADIVDGRAIALTGAVTLDSNTVTADCVVIPTPSAAALASLGIGCLAGVRRRR